MNVYIWYFDHRRIYSVIKSINFGLMVPRKVVLSCPTRRGFGQTYPRVLAAENEGMAGKESGSVEYDLRLLRFLAAGAAVATRFDLLGHEVDCDHPVDYYIAILVGY